MREIVKMIENRKELEEKKVRIIEGDGKDNRKIVRREIK